MTKYAQKLAGALRGHGLKVMVEVKDRDEDGDTIKTIDITIPEARLNVEVDGRHHVRSAKQILADIKRTETSYEKGYSTIHVTNHDIFSDIEAVANGIAEAAKIRISNYNNCKKSQMPQLHY